MEKKKVITTGKELPKILYLSDVPVELSYAGATLIYRLLEHYPSEKLLIVQGMEINSQKRISEVRYHIFNSKILDRLRNSRISRKISGLLVGFQNLRSRELTRLINDYKPDIILTVSFRLMWLKAFRLSKKSNIPLYLILHDDWLITENYGAWQESLNKEFENMYKHASERFCISLKMEKHYRSLYGVRGQVLYPFRGKNDIIFPPHQNKKKKHLKYCYAGSLFTGDFISMLNDLSGQIEEQGGELHIFSQGNKNALGEYEHLVKQHVTFHGLLDPAVLMRLMSEEMDVGILVNSFLHEESFMYNFSSKLVDYTSAGLPVLFWGPASSGAISWALSGNYKAVSIKQNSNDIARLVKLFQDNEIRMGLAKELRDLSKTDFSYENNYKLFIDKISSTS